MAIQWQYARPGYQFKPTYHGRKDGRIRKKYEDNYPNSQYKTCVPRRWVTLKLVEEVKI